MSTAARLDRDRAFGEAPDNLRPHRGEPRLAVDAEASLRALRTLLGRARGRAIRPRRGAGLHAKRSA